MVISLAGLLLMQAQPLFSRDDYPAEALRRHEQGTVEVDLLITPQGRVGGCSIVVSSGSPSLDQGTCELLAKRARYHPSTDDQGKPVEGHDHAKIRWVLPKGSHNSR
jgi:protein TonB